jgi:hypothetical protein
MTVNFFEMNRIYQRKVTDVEIPVPPILSASIPFRGHKGRTGG